MLCFAAIVPSSPLILTAKDDERVQTSWPHTLKGMDILRQACVKADLDVVVLISRFMVRDEIFGINCAETVYCSLRDYGDLSEHSYRGAPTAAHELLMACAPYAAASSEKNLPSVNAVALSLFPQPSATRILPVFLKRAAEPEECARFGRMLIEGIAPSSKRYGVIVTGDLTSKGNESTAGVSETKSSSHYHEGIITALKRKAISKLIDYAKRYPEEWKHAGFPAFLTIAAMMGEVSCQMKLYAYEEPFGVGYLTAHYVL